MSNFVLLALYPSPNKADIEKLYRNLMHPVKPWKVQRRTYR